MKPPIEPIHPGSYIRDYMNGCDEWTINNLAMKSGVDSALIEQILDENPNAVITMDISKKLARAFKISDHYFFQLQKSYEANLNQQKKFSKFNQEKILLAALSVGETNTSYNIVQIQHMMYIIDKGANKQIGTPFFDFAPSMDGPFDNSVCKNLENLKKKNYLETIVAIDEANCTSNHYKLTAKGVSKAHSLLDSIPKYLSSYLKSTNGWVMCHEDKNSFALAMKAQYPEMKLNGRKPSNSQTF